MTRGNIHWLENTLDGDVMRTVERFEAVARQRAFWENSERGDPYGSGPEGDKRALQDFLIINYAWVSPNCVHHEDELGHCTIGRNAPTDCNACPSVAHRD